MRSSNFYMLNNFAGLNKRGGECNFLINEFNTLGNIVSFKIYFLREIEKNDLNWYILNIKKLIK